MAPCESPVPHLSPIQVHTKPVQRWPDRPGRAGRDQIERNTPEEGSILGSDSSPALNLTRLPHEYQSRIASQLNIFRAQEQASSGWNERDGFSRAEADKHGPVYSHGRLLVQVHTVSSSWDFQPHHKRNRLAKERVGPGQVSSYPAADASRNRKRKMPISPYLNKRIRLHVSVFQRNQR